MEKTWLLANSSDDGENTKEDDDEETLSLVDLPQLQNPKTEQKQTYSHQDFNFCRSFSTKSEMCIADQVFFQGQIMPLGNSVGSEKGSIITRNISRTESMDQYYSNGLFSSRSSSLSSSSGSSATTLRKQRQTKPPRNQFHSYPSPSPRIQKQETFNMSNSNGNKKSSMWSVFRLGLISPPPEIVFQDFKTRYHSHRSNSNKSVNSNTGGNVKNSEKKRGIFGAGCKCSVDAVDIVSSNIMPLKERELPTVQPDEENVTRRTKLTKKQISHHRTFEWLRQLSLEGEREEA